ncbi:MAG TPA: FHA domain-containing protein [Ilumatobacter sp.]|nr:FHA domain-containing protein [Ilumatobacter sp.]
MSDTAGRAERLVDLRTLALGDATRTILDLAGQLGYSVAASGPGTYRLARTRRKLLGKDTEEVVVTVFDGRAGTQARFVGPIDAALLEHLAPLTGPPAVAPPPPGPSPAPALGAAPPAPLTPVPPAPTPVNRPSQAPVPNQIIGAVPGVAPRAAAPAPPPAPAPSAPAYPDTAEVDERTIVNLRREAVPPPAATEPGLVLPGGKFVALTTPVVLGRSPDPSRGPAGAVAVPVAEPSLSKTHLAAAATTGGVLVTDLHSSNGTVVEAGDGRARCEPGVAVFVPWGAALIAGALVIEVVGP